VPARLVHASTQAPQAAVRVLHGLSGCVHAILTLGCSAAGRPALLSFSPCLLGALGVCAGKLRSAVRTGCCGAGVMGGPQRPLHIFAQVSLFYHTTALGLAAV